MSYFQVRELCKDFGYLKAVNDVSFEVNNGKTIAIFGGNGAGKTTLIKIIATLLSPTSGTIYLNDAEIKHNSEEMRNNLGLISHSLFLYSDLNAIENLRYFGELYRVDDLGVRIDELLTEFGLLPRMYDSVRTYSRGMLQRLSIARAVIHNPKLLLLDEPFTGLDRSAAETLMLYMKSHRNGGRSILLVTHNLERGYNAADKLAIMSNGHFVWESDSESVSLDDFKQTYIQKAVEVIG